MSSSSIKECLYEEFTQSLGLPGDKTRRKYSMYNDHGNVRRFDWYDCIMLMMLYAPEVDILSDAVTLRARKKKIIDHVRSRLAQEPDLCRHDRFRIVVHPR